MWNSKTLRSLQVYYLISFMVVLTLFLLGEYHLAHQKDEVVQSPEIEINPIPDVRKFVEAGEVSTALNLLDKVIKNGRSHDKQTVKQLNELRNGLTGLSNLPSGKATIRSLHLKVNNFVELTKTNNWMRLNKLSSSLSEKLNLFFKNEGASLDELVRFSEQTLSMMKAITAGARLEASVKSKIFTEITLIEKDRLVIVDFLKSGKELSGKLDQTTTEYQKFLNRVGEKSIKAKIGDETSILRYLSRTVHNIIVGVVSLLFMIGGFFFYLNRQKSIEREFMQRFSLLMDSAIIPSKNNSVQGFSPESAVEIDHYRDYVQKRMNFGAIFQETLPFAGLLLDSNLKVIWANSLFYDFWGLSEYKGKHEGLTWDYLQKLTNLGSDTPINDALKSSIAGIYQINLKGVNQSTPFPYEMYVSPVVHDGQMRIMILFYPLKSLEEGLSMQLDSIRGTIGKAISAIHTGELNEALTALIKDELDSNGLDDLYAMLIKLNDEQKEHVLILSNRIEELEIDLQQKNQKVDLITNTLTKNRQVFTKEVTLFESIKEKLLHLLESRDDQKDLIKNLYVVLKDSESHVNELLVSIEKMEDITADCVKILGSTEKGRAELRKCKEEIDLEKSDLIQKIDRMVIFGKSGNTEELAALKNSMRDLERRLLNLDKIVTEVDVALNKIDHVIYDFEKIAVGEIKEHLASAGSLVDGNFHAIFQSIQKSEGKDESLVNDLQDSYQVHKELIRGFNHVDSSDFSCQQTT